MVLFSSLSHAEWKLAREVKVGSIYVDLDRAVREKDSVKVWALTDFNEPQKSEGLNRPVVYRSVLVNFAFDCKKRLYQQTRVLYFSDPMGKGNEVDSGFERGYFADIVPDSFDELIFDQVCKQRKK